MDASTTFFFSLEKSVARTKPMVCLRLPDGTLTAEQREMRRHVVDFYGTLCGAEDCSRECQDELLQGRPQLSCRDRATLDGDVSQEEPTAAVGQMASGHAPGLDGLPACGYLQALLGVPGRRTCGRCCWSALEQDYFLLRVGIQYFP